MHIWEDIKFYARTWICDPDKCKYCTKESCQTYCFRTSNKEYRATGKTWFKNVAKLIKTKNPCVVSWRHDEEDDT